VGVTVSEWPLADLDREKNIIVGVLSRPTRRRRPPTIWSPPG
jgi:hypothetical protein